MIRLSLIQRSLLAFLIMCAVLPFLVWAADQSLGSMFNSPFLWVPLGNEKKDQFWQFVNDFKTQDTVIVSWPGCTIDDERLPQLASRLLSDAPAGEGKTCRDLFQRVSTGYSVVRELQEPPLNLSREASLERLKGTLIGPDGETSCAIIVMTLDGVLHRELSINAIRDTVERDLGVPDEQCHVGGLLVAGLAIDQESTRALDRFTIPSVVLVVLICWYCLGSWRLMLPIIFVAAFGERLVLSTVYLSGGNMNAVLIVMSPFVFVLVVSAGVHMANYYKEEVRMHGAEGAAVRALRIGVVPCGLAALTTTIGLLSLLISDIVPVREFGTYSALCMLIAEGLLILLIFPGFVDKFPVVLGRGRDELNAQRGKTGDILLGAIARFVCRRSGWVVAGSLILMVVTGWGITRIHTTVDVLALLPADSRTTRDHKWLEDHVAPLAQLEIVLNFPLDGPLDLLARLELVQQVQHDVASVSSIGGTMSALTFVRDIPASGGIRGTMQRSVFRGRVQQALPRLVDLGYLHQSQTQQSWRVTARAPALGGVDFEQLVEALEQTVDPLVQGAGGELATGVTVTYTGSMPIVVDAQRILLGELTSSYLAAFGVIAAVIVLTVRNVTAGLVAMLPNLFPTVILFGTMGWIGKPLDIGALMTASVALGIAVDDTLHLLLWFRRDLPSAPSATAAVTSALHHCGRAMIHSTLICGCGMLVFTLAEFEPTRQFALMMFLLLAAALIGDLFLLPALLVGPFRRVFDPSRQRSHE